MIVIVDTREQAPYGFEGFDCTVESSTLTTGDYSINGFEDRVAVERKSLGDLISTIGSKRRKVFVKELERASSMERFCVVVESSLDDIAKGRYRSNMRPHSAIQTMVAYWIRYNIPFFYADSREGGEYITYSILSKYLYEIDKRHKQAVRGQA